LITVPVPVPPKPNYGSGSGSGKKLRFLRFRFRNTGTYGTSATTDNKLKSISSKTEGILPELIYPVVNICKNASLIAFYRKMPEKEQLCRPHEVLHFLRVQSRELISSKKESRKVMEKVTES